MEGIVLNEVSKEELSGLITEIVSETVSKQFNESLKYFKPRRDRFLPRIETAEILRITLPTLRAYTLKGIIPGYRFGGRVLYHSDQIEECLIKISTKDFH